MYASVLLGLVLALVSLELVPAGLAPPSPDAATTLLAVAGLAAGVFGVGLVLGWLLLRGRNSLGPGEQRFLRKVGLAAKAYRFFVLAAYALVLFGFRWTDLAVDWAGGGGWLMPTFALVLAPFMVLLVLSWTALYRANRGLRAMMFERAGVAAPRAALPRYLVFLFRQYVLVLLVPLLALLAVHDCLAHTLGTVEAKPFAAVGQAGALLVIVFVSGLWIRLCWLTEPLPDGDLLDRLLALARRARIRVARILVWRTNLSIANGCMVGAVGPLRYILITDALLLSLPNEEVEAVFAHEAAHVKYRHLLLYLAMGIGGLAAATLVAELAAGLAGAVWGAGATEFVWAVDAAVIVFVMAYWWVGFGFVSRRCELECDLYAVRAASCPVGCSAPDPRRYLDKGDPRPPPICVHRVEVFTAALRRIARLNGTAETARGWRHFSVARRCDFLLRVLAEPARALDFQRRLRWLKRAALVAALAATIGVAALSLSAQPSEPNHPEDPGCPQDVIPPAYRWLVRFVDWDEVNAVAIRSPKFYRHADAPAHLDDRRLAGLGPLATPGNDNVAVRNPRRHAVAVHAQAERPRRRLDAREGDELNGAVGGRLGELDKHRLGACRRFALVLGVSGA